MRPRLKPMPATSPATKAEDWADAVVLRPAGEPDPDGLGVPRFALIETRGPDPWALLLSLMILTSLVSLPVIFGRFLRTTRVIPPENVTLLVLPPALRTLPDISTNRSAGRKPARPGAMAKRLTDTVPLPVPVKPHASLVRS